MAQKIIWPNVWKMKWAFFLTILFSVAFSEVDFLNAYINLWYRLINTTTAGIYVIIRVHMDHIQRLPLKIQLKMVDIQNIQSHP